MAQDESMTTQAQPAATEPSRRQALQRLSALVALQALGAGMAACGGGGDAAAAAPAPVSLPPPPASPPPPSPLGRLKAALLRAPLAVSVTPVTVTQASGNASATSLGPDAVFHPPLTNNAQALSLANVPQVWGHRRDRWVLQAGAVIAGQAVYPVNRSHPAATTSSGGICGLHFWLEGRDFEVLFAGTDAQITLVADGQYMAPQLIRTTLAQGQPGALLSLPEPSVRLDFGSVARRQISLYAVSSRGPCAVVTRVGDRIEAWDRSVEASFGGMADSYGGARGRHWRGGPFWEAAALLGIPHLDLDAVGGTGYAPNNTNNETRNTGNAFPARLASSVDVLPDLFFTAGGINDNNSHAAPPLYATAAAAMAAFNAAVDGHYRQLRAALPLSVLVAMGPWRPRTVADTQAVEQSKADAVLAALQAVGGPWVFLDNLRGGWRNSAGASSTAGGPWQTGTGHSGAPAGDGNGDLYLEADGVHPNEAGCVYLAGRIATDLRAALSAL